MKISAEERQAERKRPIPPQTRTFARLAVTEAYLHLAKDYPHRQKTDLPNENFALVGQVKVSKPMLMEESQAEKAGFYQITFNTTPLEGEAPKSVRQTIALVREYNKGDQHESYKEDISKLNSEPRTDPVTGFPDWIVGNRKGETHVIGSNVTLFKQAQEKQTTVTDMLQQQGWDVNGKIEIIDRDRFAGHRTSSGEIINAR